VIAGATHHLVETTASHLGKCFIRYFLPTPTSKVVARMSELVLTDAHQQPANRTERAVAAAQFDADLTIPDEPPGLSEPNAVHLVARAAVHTVPLRGSSGREQADHIELALGTEGIGRILGQLH
jgi:hypothetical protein